MTTKLQDTTNPENYNITFRSMKVLDLNEVLSCDRNNFRFKIKLLFVPVECH